MPVRLLSLFGSYDFFAKSLPGMSLVVGLFPLLKANSVPIPDLSQRIVVFVVILVVIWLVGTLLGEAVHSIAIHVEKIAAWGGKTARSMKDYISNITGFSLPHPTGYSTASEYSINGQNDSIEQDSFLLRKYQSFKHLVIGWYSGLYNWSINRRNGIIYIVWGHRDMFETRLKAPTSSSSFTHQYLVDFVRNELDDEPPFNSDEVYTVIVSQLSLSQCERAFRFQSRYGFCRSMGVVLLLIGSSYLLTSKYPSSWWVPSSLQYKPYLFDYFPQNTHSVISTISILLIAISLLFFLASGDYKRRYIEYLLSEFYTINKFSDDVD